MLSRSEQARVCVGCGHDLPPRTGNRGRPLARCRKDCGRDRSTWKEPSKTARARYVRWRDAHPQRVVELSRSWKTTHREAKRNQDHVRRARMRAVRVEHVDARAIYVAARGICTYCGDAVNERTSSLDHVLPFALGGSHTTANLVLACRRCNFSKGARTLEQWADTLPSERRSKILLIAEAMSCGRAPRAVGSSRLSAKSGSDGRNFPADTSGH